MGRAVTSVAAFFVPVGLGSSRGFLTHAGRTSPENGLDAIFKRVFMNISLYAFRERFTPAGACRY